MRKKIQDEFSHLPISRQRKYQLRMARDKRCTECGAPAVMGSRCLEHLVKARERQRKKRGLRKRYHNTLSYRLQLEAGIPLPSGSGNQAYSNPAPAATRTARAAKSSSRTAAKTRSTKSRKD